VRDLTTRNTSETEAAVYTGQETHNGLGPTKFKVADARRVLSFCLDRPFDVQISEEGSHRQIRITPPDSDIAQVFQADTFEEALRAVARAGLVRCECIERQIAFTQSAWERSFEAKAGQWNGPAFPPAAGLESASFPPTRELTAAHYRGLAELRYQMRTFVRFSEQAARGAGLEPPQHQLLLAIRGLPPARRANLATLAERLCTDVEGCEALALGLLERQLVRLLPNPADRREQLLALTEAGEALLRDLTVLHRNQMLAVGPTWVQALGAILSSLEDSE
jgi:DNA-binding MarR family transcriptional regulator